MRPQEQRPGSPESPSPSEPGLLPKEPFPLVTGPTVGAASRCQEWGREAGSGGRKGGWQFGSYVRTQAHGSPPPSSGTGPVLKAHRGPRLVSLPPLTLLPQFPKPLLTFPQHKSTRSLPCFKPFRGSPEPGTQSLPIPELPPTSPLGLLDLHPSSLPGASLSLECPASQLPLRLLPLPASPSLLSKSDPDFRAQGYGCPHLQGVFGLGCPTVPVAMGPSLPSREPLSIRALPISPEPAWRRSGPSGSGSPLSQVCLAWHHTGICWTRCPADLPWSLTCSCLLIPVRTLSGSFSPWPSGPIALNVQRPQLLRGGLGTGVCSCHSIQHLKD